MSTQFHHHNEAIHWIQKYYGGRKLGKVFGKKNQWLVCSYFSSASTLILGTAQGPSEARIMRERGDLHEIDVSDCIDLPDFKTKFRRLLKQ